MARNFFYYKFSEFCSAERINHEFSTPITPHQNGVIERKNRTLQEASRVTLHAKNLPCHFWAEAMNTAYHNHNRVTIISGTKATMYEFWKRRKPNVEYFHVFGSKRYILVDHEQRGKLIQRVMWGYSLVNLSITKPTGCIIFIPR